jgi:Spy/CpxP family protein refolding chaperone
MKLSHTLFALAVGLGVAAPVQAQGPGAGMRDRGQMLQNRNQRLLQGIELTTTQKAAVDSVTEAYQAKMPKLEPGTRPAPEEMQAFRKVAEDQATAVRTLLTPEQQTLFDKNREAMPRRRGAPPSGS